MKNQTQKKPKLKILEITEFSAGICGVWTRVKEEAKLLAMKGYDMNVFSSNIVKGTNKIAKSYEKIDNVKIYRFPHKTGFLDGSLTKNVTYFNFEKKFNEIMPDIVITHLIHPHSFKTLKICIKNKIPCYLVTHAPFEVKRNFLLSLLTKLYYSIKVLPNIKKFTKVIAITKWELPYLIKLGISEKKIIYIPNGIPEKFFKEKIKKFNKRKIIFLGRISPVKDLKTLISAFNKLKNLNLKLEIIGPIEKGYTYIKKFENKNIKFLPAIYNLNKKIKKIQEADIFVLPSKREAMPQALIEAMALGKVVISSDTIGAKELIQDKINGFLFKIQDVEDLKDKIKSIINMKQERIIKIQKNARNSVKKFNWKNIIKKIESLIKL